MVGEAQADRLLDESNWQLTVFNNADAPVTISFSDLLQLPQTTACWDIHCVTRWSRQGDQFTGVLFRDLLSALGINRRQGYVRFVAYSERNHDTTLPLNLCLDDGVMLVHKINHEPLLPQHGFPVRTFVPSRYFYKSLKWLKEIHFIEQDQLGYWERGGYHNQADFLTEQRYTSGNLTAKELASLRRTLNFAKYRGQVLLSLDLSGLDLTGADLSGVQLKNCNLENCQLAGANLTAANLSNSTLIGSNLSNANLTGADLDGVLLMACDLTNAQLNNTFLNATEFTRSGFLPAVIKNTHFVGAQLNGLVEQQQSYLVSAGAVF